MLEAAKNKAFSVWLLLISAVFLSFLPALFYVFWDASIFIGYLIAIVCAVALVKPFHASKVKTLMVSGLAAVVFITSFHFRFNEVTYLMKYKVLLEPKFLACQNTAIPVASKGAIGVCERHDVVKGEEVDAIVYDSTDEIGLPASQRSEEWKSAVSTKSNAPFGIMGFSVQKLTGHYYQVYFSSVGSFNNYSL